MNINQYVDKYVEITLSYVGVAKMKGIVFHNQIIGHKLYDNICLIDDRSYITNLTGLLKVINENPELSIEINEIQLTDDMNIDKELKIIELNDKFVSIQKDIDFYYNQVKENTKTV